MNTRTVLIRNVFGTALISILALGCDNARSNVAFQTPAPSPEPSTGTSEMPSASPTGELEDPSETPAPTEEESPAEMPTGEPSPTDEPAPTSEPTPASSPSGTSTGTYAANPDDYLSQEDKAILRSSSVRALAPTQLPDWTRDVDPLVFLSEYEDTYFITWTRPYDENDDLTVALGSELVLQLTGNLYVPGDPQRLAPGTRGGRRDYFYDDAVCERKQSATASDEEEIGQEGVVLFNATGRTYYQLTLVPGPACSDGLYGQGDAIAVMDSLERVASPR